MSQKLIDYSGAHPSINKKKSFSELYPQHKRQFWGDFTGLLKQFDVELKAIEPSLKTGALSNARGDWYEWLLAIIAWNIRIKHNGTKLILLVPNVTTFDVSNLYTENISDLISDLKAKVLTASKVELITSNPDFVIIDTNSFDELPAKFSQPITAVTPDTLTMIEHAYADFIGMCSFEDIVGYLSVKTSLRPDRRLQIAHEGSLMKALYAHIQTREWIISPKGLKYYAMSMALNNSDKRALKTVATHSILTVNSLPEAAVNEAFMVNSSRNAIKSFKEIMDIA